MLRHVVVQERGRVGSGVRVGSGFHESGKNYHEAKRSTREAKPSGYFAEAEWYFAGVRRTALQKARSASHHSPASLARFAREVLWKYP